jgi:hypothetical protein
MELTSHRYVFQNTLGDISMTRSVALRAFCIFTILTVLAAVTGAASHVEIAEILFLIGGSLAAIMLFFAFAIPAPVPVPVRARRRR